MSQLFKSRSLLIAVSTAMAGSLWISCNERTTSELADGESSPIKVGIFSDQGPIYISVPNTFEKVSYCSTSNPKDYEQTCLKNNANYKNLDTSVQKNNKKRFAVPLRPNATSPLTIMFVERQGDKNGAYRAVVISRKADQQANPNNAPAQNLASCDQKAQDLLVEHNKIRAGLNLNPLRLNDILCKVAKAHTDYLVANPIEAKLKGVHNAGGLSAQRVPAAGYKGTETWRENYAWGNPQLTATIILFGLPADNGKGGWMNSPGHRVQVVSPAVDEVGFGCTTYSGGEQCIANYAKSAP